MVHLRPSHWFLACSLLGILGYTATVSQESAEKEEEAAPWSPGEVHRMRESFIEQFRRIPLNTTPGDAMMLRILVESTGARRGVEVGTATGYGALQMGVGFERTGGHLTTIDIDPEMVRKARENIRKAKLDRTVTVVEGDALEAIPRLEGKFDFVFIDAVKKDYMKYFQALYPMLEPGAVIVADNVVRFREQMKDFLDAMEEDPDYDMVIVRCSEEKGDGMAIIHKRR